MKSYCIPLLFTLVSFQQSFAQEDSLRVITDTVASVSVPVTTDTILKPVEEKASIAEVSAEYDKSKANKPFSPYHRKFWVDAPIIAGGIGLTALGVKLISDKRALTPEELALLKPEDVNSFDRSNAGQYSKKVDEDSYLIFQGSFGVPVLMALLDGKQRKKFGQIAVLYVETMAITGAMFTMATGNVYRNRPFMYGTEAPLDLRLDKDSRRSFYAGHTAATAAATFFAAKVYNDFHPNSNFKYVLWASALTLPAIVAHQRYKAGMHFLSDNIIGYVLGAATGILVPHFHKTKALKNVSFMPQAGQGYNGIAIRYHLK